MMRKYLLILPAIAALVCCSKDVVTNADTYIVSAGKMIGLTGSNWSNAELQLNNKRGCQYTASDSSSGALIKAIVHLPAIDDSNRAVNGSVLLNIGNDNIVNYVSFNTDPLSQATAYAMMLNYNKASLQTLTNISSSIGEVVENGSGGNTTADVVLSKLSSGQMADQLGITYTSGRSHFGMVVFRQSNGSYIFSYRGTW